MNKEDEYFVKKQELENNTELSDVAMLVQRTALFTEYCNVPLLAEDPRENQSPFFKELTKLMVDLLRAIQYGQENNLPENTIENLVKCSHTVTKMWDDSSMLKRLLSSFEMK